MCLTDVVQGGDQQRELSVSKLKSKDHNVCLSIICPALTLTKELGLWKPHYVNSQTSASSHL